MYFTTVWNVGLPDLANKITRLPVKFEFQINISEIIFKNTVDP